MGEKIPVTCKTLNFQLYLVTDRRWLKDRNLADCVEAAVLGGVTLVQLREKDIFSREFFKLAQQVKRVTERYGIPLIINDRIDIALAVDADGVHIGLDDLPVPVARKLLGSDKIIGASVTTIDEAVLFQNQGADYLGVGAVFPTATKPENEAVSLATLRSIKAAVRIPVVAIGGIQKENVPQVMQTGVDGIAVVSAIMNQTDITQASALLKSLV